MTTYNKSLKPNIETLFSEYNRTAYPTFVQFAEEVLGYMEEENSLTYFTDESDSVKKTNSLYQNIVSFSKFFDFDSIPTINTEFFNAAFSDYASSVDFREVNLYVSVEKLKRIMQYATMMYRLKDSWRGYNMFVKLIDEYISISSTKEIDFRVYFHDDFTTQPPDFSSIPEDQIILCEIPTYSLTNLVFSGSIYVASDFPTTADVVNGMSYLVKTSVTDNDATKTNTGQSFTLDQQIKWNGATWDVFTDLTVNRTAITAADKGKYLFEYQIASNSDLTRTGRFSRSMIDNFHPAGFVVDNIVQINDVATNVKIENKNFQVTEYIIECET